MTKTKKTLIITVASVITIAAAALLIIFSGPKQTPWNMTYSITPGEISAAYVWSEKAHYVPKDLTEDEIKQAVQLLNQLEKHNFRENSSHHGTTPAYGLVIKYGAAELTLTQVGGTKVEMNFDAETAKALYTDQWVVDNTALTDFVRGLCGYTLTEEAAL